MNKYRKIIILLIFVISSYLVFLNKTDRTSLFNQNRFRNSHFGVEILLPQGWEYFKNISPEAIETSSYPGLSEPPSITLVKGSDCIVQIGNQGGSGAPYKMDVSSQIIDQVKFDKKSFYDLDAEEYDINDLRFIAYLSDERNVKFDHVWVWPSLDDPSTCLENVNNLLNQIKFFE